MNKKFDITGRSAGVPGVSSIEDTLDEFIRGVEPVTTMTVQIYERQKRALKQAALDRKTTVKALLMEIIDLHFPSTKQ
jgi:hypothetical protein